MGRKALMALGAGTALSFVTDCCSAACIEDTRIVIDRSDQQPFPSGTYEIMLRLDGVTFALSCPTADRLPSLSTGGPVPCDWTQGGPYAGTTAFSPYAAYSPDARGIFINLPKVTPATATVDVTLDGITVAVMVEPIQYQTPQVCGTACRAGHVAAHIN